MSNKPLANPNAFTGVSPPWSLTQLDANFTAVQNTINDLLTYCNYFVDQSGVANSVILSISSALTVSLTAGTLLFVKIANTNTAAVTMTVNALAAQNVVNPDLTALSPSQLLAGQVAALMYDGTRFQLLGAFILPPNARTATEIAAGGVPTNPAYLPWPEDIRRYGAVDGAADVTTNIQNAINALNGGTLGGGVVLIPGDANSVWNISNSLSLPKRAAGSNYTKWYGIRGLGRGAGQVTAIAGLANKQMIDGSGTSLAVLNYYREYKDLYLGGANIAQTGIDFSFNQHGLIENVWINGLANGAGSAAGVLVNGCIDSIFQGLKVHDGNGTGMLASGGSGNFFNANFVAGCSFLNVTDGSNFTGGISGNTWVGNNFENCSNIGFRCAGYSAGSNFMAGNYFELNVNADLSLGELTQLESFVLMGNYINGFSAGTSAATYTPIKVKFANNCHFLRNQVNVATKSASGYLMFDLNVAGGSITGCTLEGNTVRALAATTAPNTIYNLPGNFVNLNNAIIDPIFAPFLQTAICRGRLPYGGWSLTAGGAGVTARGADIEGSSSIELKRPAGGDSASMTQIFPVGTEFQNRFVTFAMPLKELAAGGLSGCSIACVPNGTSPQSTTLTTSTLTLNQTTIVYVLMFCPSDCTQITVTVTITTAGGDMLCGQPCMYIGARPFYSAAGDEMWYATAAPATGTWKQGDIVWFTNVAAGAAPGAVCVVAGTPGTWKNMAAVAA